jgi:hypothetical protein
MGAAAFWWHQIMQKGKRQNIWDASYSLSLTFIVIRIQSAGFLELHFEIEASQRGFCLE